MSRFLYPRKVSITRERKADNPGEQMDYGGANVKRMDTVATSLIAHIEAERQGTSPGVKLPGDTAGQSIWSISFPRKIAPLGFIRSRDVITDELGQEYYVISADWSPLCTVCRAQILES